MVKNVLPLEPWLKRQAVNPVFTTLWKKQGMLKSFLIAVAVLVTVDAGVWDSRYRREFAVACERLAARVTGQDWASGPLV